MGETLAHGLAGLQRGLQGLAPDPPRGKSCAVCGGKLVARDDPFCSAVCCQKWHGTYKQVDVGARGRKYSVRDGELHCSTCKRWLPDEGFQRNKSNTWRRGRQQNCRECRSMREAGKRAERRRRAKEKDPLSGVPSATSAV